MKQQMRYFLILFMLLLISCSKQETPEIIIQKNYDNLESCGKVNFGDDFLEHGNIVSFFECSNWKTRFPEIYQAISATEKDDWNHVWLALSKVYFNDQARRDRILKYTRELDSVGGLDDFAKVVSVLNETNFFDFLRDMFLCAENNTCGDRKVKMTKDDIKGLITSVNIDQKTYLTLSEIFTQLVGVIKPRSEELRTEFNKLFQDETFLKQRIRTADSIFEKLSSEGLDTQDRSLVTKFLTVKKSSSEMPWFYYWVNSLAATPNVFEDVFIYPSKYEPTILKDLEILNVAFDRELDCPTEYNGETGQYTPFEIDLKSAATTFATILNRGSFSEFYNLAMQTSFNFKIAAEACPLLTNYVEKIPDYLNDGKEITHKINYIHLINEVTKFLDNKSYFEIIKYLATISIQTDSKEENLYLAKLFGGKIAANFIEFNRVASERSRVFPLVQSLLLDLGPKTMLQLGIVNSKAFSSTNDDAIKNFSKAWLFNEEKEKNFFLKFIDAHYKDKNNFVALFDFYQKIFYEVSQTSNVINEQWFADEDKKDKTYKSLRSFAYNFSGEAMRKDLEKFFKREELLEVVEILTRGIGASGSAQTSIILTDNYEDYLKAMNNLPFEVKPSGKSSEIGVVNCINSLAQDGWGFYRLTVEMPKECKDIDSKDIAYKIFSNINFVSHDFKPYRPYGQIGTFVNTNSGLFDQTGLFNKSMFNTTIANIKLLDSLFAPYSKDTGGVFYVMDVIHEHLFELPHYVENNNGECSGEKCFGYMSELENLSTFLQDFITISPKDGVLYRRDVLSKIFAKEDFKIFMNALADSASLMKDYSNAMYGKPTNFYSSKKELDKNYECKNFLNQNINNACPDQNTITTSLANVLQKMKTPIRSDDTSNTSLNNLVDALLPGVGFKIPINNKKQKAHQFSLEEIFKFLYDSTDKRMPVNQKSITYTKKDGKPVAEPATTLERIESVIREVRFDSNYLGAHYENSIALSDNYSNETKHKKNLFELCINIKFCGKAMNGEDLRMARNTIRTFDGLIDINEPAQGLKYGETLQTLASIFISSSKYDTQTAYIWKKQVGKTIYEIPWLLSKKDLKYHNGQIITDIAMLNVLSNAGRIIHDRVGRTRSEFESFIASKEFKMMNNAFLRGFNRSQTIPVVNHIVDKFLAKRSDNTTLLSDSVKWVSSLNYEEVQILESMLKNAFVVASYLGSPEDVYGSNDLGSDIAHRYQNNNVFKLFVVLDQVFSKIDLLTQKFPENKKLITLVRSTNNFLEFYKNGLIRSSTASNPYYKSLNELFFQIDRTVLSPTESGKVGLNFILALMDNENSINKMYTAFFGVYDYINRIHYVKSPDFMDTTRIYTLGDNAQKILYSSTVNFDPVWDYMRYTTMECIGTKDGKCIENYHYDELASLLIYFNNIKDQKSNIRNFFELLFKDEINNLKDMVSIITSAIKIKTTKLWR